MIDMKVETPAGVAYLKADDRFVTNYGGTECEVAYKIIDGKLWLNALVENDLTCGDFCLCNEGVFCEVGKIMPDDYDEWVVSGKVVADGIAPLPFRIVYTEYPDDESDEALADDIREFIANEYPEYPDEVNFLKALNDNDIWGRIVLEGDDWGEV